jgi:RNA polymerase sigma-70 factor, ECF subfamily
VTPVGSRCVAPVDARLPPEEAISADLLELVRRCQGGDPDAWRAFLSPLQEIGRRALRSFRLPAADAEDIIAEALTTLYAGGLSQFRGGTVAEFVAFLKAVVRNRAIDVVKGQKRQEVYPEDLAAKTAGSAPSDFSTEISEAECVEFLRQEVARLKREDQELYLMKARGMKEREIAELTGRPPGTIASQIARLLERLRASLKDRGCT